MVQDRGLEPLASGFVDPRSDPDELILQNKLSSSATRPLGHLWLWFPVAITFAKLALGFLGRIPDESRCQSQIRCAWHDSYPRPTAYSIQHIKIGRRWQARTAVPRLEGVILSCWTNRPNMVEPVGLEPT